MVSLAGHCQQTLATWDPGSGGVAGDFVPTGYLCLRCLLHSLRRAVPCATVYTYTQARQNLASLLDQAIVEGEVRIRRRDGTVFVVRLERSSQSPLDVPVVDLGISTREIVDYIAEGRRYVEES